MVTQLTTARDLLDQTRAHMGQFLTAHPNQAGLVAQLNAIQGDLVTLQRSTAAPVPVRFHIQRLDK